MAKSIQTTKKSTTIKTKSNSTSGSVKKKKFKNKSLGKKNKKRKSYLESLQKKLKFQIDDVFGDLRRVEKKIEKVYNGFSSKKVAPAREKVAAYEKKAKANLEQFRSRIDKNIHLVPVEIEKVANRVNAEMDRIRKQAEDSFAHLKTQLSELVATEKKRRRG